jgi:hypothetical protein
MPSDSFASAVERRNMTDGQFDLRPILLVLVIIAIVLAVAQAAIAKPRNGGSGIDEGLTVVSSTVLGEDTFTMTAWNISLDPIDVSLSPPGLVSAVVVDTGTFDGLWTIDGLEAGATGTMIGVIET